MNEKKRFNFKMNEAIEIFNFEIDSNNVFMSRRILKKFLLK